MKCDPSTTAGFAKGQKLAGCYILKTNLGGAEECEIWLAQDEILGKDVSLHFVPASLLGDADAMNGLRSEVKRARQLIHPNILRVYDLVEEGDWAAVSMDAFVGESLAARLAKTHGSGLTVEELHPWIAQLCRTLDDAHKIKVVHGDVSPENVLLCASPETVLLGEGGKLFLINFGIGRVLADAEERVSGKRNPRMAARSPQQLAGSAPTRLDDVYGIGALLFEALTGRLPFTGEDLAGQIQTARPPAISTLRAKESGEIPEVWEQTIAACLEKSPEARPQTADEIAKRLVLSGAEPKRATAEAQKTAEEKASVAPEKIAPKEIGLEPDVETRPAADFSPSSVKSASTETSGQSMSEPETSSAAYKKRSRFPALLLAASLLIIGAVGYYINGMGQAKLSSEVTPSLQTAGQSEELELRPVSNKMEVSRVSKPAQPAQGSKPGPEIPLVKPAPAEPIKLAANAATAPLAAASGVAPATPVSSIPPGEEEKQLVEKAAALDRAKQAALAAEKAREEIVRKQQQADASVADVQKTLDQKTKALAPVRKAFDEVLAQRKKLEEEQKAAELAAEQARQAAAEKARLADAAKKAIADLEAKNKQKLAAQEKAEAEIQALQKTLADQQQSGASAARAAAEAEASHQKFLAAIKQSEQEFEQAKVAAAEARRLREEAEAERRKLGQELAEMQLLMEKKKAEIETRLKKLESPDAKTVAPAREPVKPPEVTKPASGSTPPPVVAKPLAQSTPPAATPAPLAPTLAVATPKPVLVPVATPPPATPAVIAAEPKTAPATPQPATPTQLALKTEPDKKVPTPAAPKSGNSATGWENSLGMRFLPVGDVDFCIWQTRVKDFEAFAKAVNLKSAAWKGPGFKQGPDHPVVNVTWVEAVAFCKWLTDLEHKDGVLPPNLFYRLPTDLEWSRAVGLSEEAGKTPEARDMGVADVYPWGTQWPPPPGSGNYTGEETGSDVAIKGYDDGFPWTSPVGSFPPNKFGLYDMGGNVWQWCMDAWNNDSKAKVLRGASWYNGALKLSLLSSCRVHASPDSSTDNYGFRIVRASDGGKSAKNKP